jgi:hypothetical protein
MDRGGHDARHDSSAVTLDELDIAARLRTRSSKRSLTVLGQGSAPLFASQAAQIRIPQGRRPSQGNERVGTPEMEVGRFLLISSARCPAELGNKDARVAEP